MHFNLVWKQARSDLGRSDPEPSLSPLFSVLGLERRLVLYSRQYPYPPQITSLGLGLALSPSRVVMRNLVGLGRSKP
jgi:hypothetical protein